MPRDIKPNIRITVCRFLTQQMQICDKGVISTRSNTKLKNAIINTLLTSVCKLASVYGSAEIAVNAQPYKSTEMNDLQQKQKEK